MPIRCVIFDFDGTLTQVDEECIPFVQTYKTELARDLELTDRELDDRWATAESAVDERVTEFGWTDREGRIVAPAYADPMIKSRVVATELLARLRMYEEDGARLALLDRLFQTSYASMDPHGIFRPEAAEVLTAIAAADLPLFVVTNSNADKVRFKLQSVVPSLLSKLMVIGDARKYEVVSDAPGDVAWDGPAKVDGKLAIEGLPRPVYPRRPQYLARLQEIQKVTGCAAHELVVCGDIWELDLLLPGKLGMQVHLVNRPQTAELDQRTVRELLEGTVSDTLHGLTERLGLVVRAA